MPPIRTPVTHRHRPARTPSTAKAGTSGTPSRTSRSPGVDCRYSSVGRLTASTDLNGYRTALVYTGGLLRSVSAYTDPQGTPNPGHRTLSVAWSGSHIASVTDPAGRKVSFGYDASGNLARYTDVA